MNKVFRVVIERENGDKKIIREEFRYAAQRMDDVWQELEQVREDEDRTIIGIIEEAPALIVLKP